MEPVLFFGAPGGCSLGSLVALEWSGISYKLCRVPLGDADASQQYRTGNPLGQTPCLRVGDKLLGQSLAILRHIARQSSDPRMGPKTSDGSHSVERLDMMLGFLHTSFFGAFGPLWMAMHGASEAEKTVLIASGAERVRIAHEQLELLIGDRPWLAGNEPTIADAYFAGVARWNDIHQAIDQRKFRRITELREKLDLLPAVRFAYALENGLPGVSSGGFRGLLRMDVALKGIEGLA